MLSERAEPTYVAIVDDDAAMGKSVRYLLASVGISAELFSTAAELIESLGEYTPDCLVLDLRLPDMSGLELFRRVSDILGACPPCIIVTGHGDITSAVEALKCGVLDFLEKPFVPQHLLDQVQIGLRRSREEREHRQRRTRTARALADLSQREQEVLDHLMLGKPNKQIAVELDLSVKTIATHRANILQKLGASSLVELVQLMLKPAGRGQ